MPAAASSRPQAGVSRKRGRGALIALLLPAMLLASTSVGCARQVERNVEEELETTGAEETSRATPGSPQPVFVSALIPAARP